MFDDFFIRALVAGIGVAFVTGPLGCFVVWRRLSYFGDTLAHSALLGVTIAYSFELNIAVSVFIISSVIALILIQLQKLGYIDQNGGLCHMENPLRQLLFAWKCFLKPLVFRYF